MPPFSYPRDRATADKALFHYPDFATNAQYKDVFQEAVYILYGRDYEIKMDLNKRMNFCCTVCNKMMNSTQALTAHNNSAAHLKRNADMKVDGYGMHALPTSSATVLASRYPPDSLEFQILRSNVKVLGVHLIEAYCYRKNMSAYYKCILCGAHGKREAIYKHLIGDKHTDRFIRFSVQIDTASLSPDHRNGLRKRLADRDGLDVDRIKTFKERNLYPHKWEQEGLPKNALLEKYRNRQHSPVPVSPGKRNPHRRQTRSPSPVRGHSSVRDRLGSPRSRGSSVKRESDDDQLTENLQTLLSDYRSTAVKQERTVLETPGGVIIQRETSAPKRDQEAQVYTNWAVERCLFKLNFIVHTHSLKASEVVSQEDVREVLSLMFSVGNLLYFTLQSLKKECRDPVKKTQLEMIIQNVNKMQGSVNVIMAQKWDNDNPSHLPMQRCLGLTKKTWNQAL